MLIDLRNCRSNRFTILFLVTILLIVFFQINNFNRWDQFMYYITKLQSEFNKDAAVKIKLLRDSYSTELFQALLASSFLYGAIHAIGPGHGKSIITGWILSQRRHLKDIAFVAIGATFLHAFSAVAIVASIFYLVGKYLPGTMGTMYLWLNVTSGVILAITGLQLFAENYKHYSKQPSTTKTPSNDLQSVHPAWITLSIGIVPCPLATAMFIYCLTTNMIVNGLLLVAAFALGMGLTLFLVAMTVWLIKNTATRSYKSATPGRFFTLMSLMSALFFILFGLLIALPNIQKLL